MFLNSQEILRNTKDHHGNAYKGILRHTTGRKGILRNSQEHYGKGILRKTKDYQGILRNEGIPRIAKEYCGMRKEY